MTETDVLTLSGDDLNRAVEKWLWGDDGTVGDSDRRIYEAVATGWLRDGNWRWSGQHFDDVSCGWLNTENAWRFRFHAPYQSAIEAHVSAWRATFPPRSGLEVIERARGLGIYIHIRPTRLGYIVDAWDTSERLDFVVCSVEEMPVVVKRLAVYAAMRMQEENA